jgi:hypothetical protein
MSYTGFRIPNNVSSLGGNTPALLFFVADDADVSKLKPGIVVKRGTDPGTVTDFDSSGNDVGFLSYNNTPIMGRPEGITGLFTAGKQVGIDTGAGRLQLAYIASGENLGSDAPLKVVTDGRLGAGVPGTDDIIGDTLEPVDARTGELGTWIIARK